MGNGEGKAFADLSQEYLYKVFLGFNPEWGAIWGIPGFDCRRITFTPKALRDENEATEQTYQRLKKINISKLTRDEALDYKVMGGGLEIDLHDMNSDRAILSPSDFLLFDGIDCLMDRDVENLDNKILRRLRQIPRVLTEGRRSLQKEFNEQSIEWARTGLEACGDGRIFLTDTILDDERVRKSEKYREIVKASKGAIEATLEYEDFLENKLLRKAQGTFAVGEERFRLALTNMHFLELEPDEIFEFGKKLAAKTKRQLRELVKDTGHTVLGYDKLQKRNRPAEEKVLEMYVRHQERAIKFIKEHNLVPWEHKEVMRTKRMKAHLIRLLPYAAYLAPPFQGDQIGDTLVNISARENLREQTHAFIRSVTVHEGYPGHHFQMSLANYLARKRPSSWIRLLNEGSTMYEGWGMYCEQLMSEEGFHTHRNDEFMLLKDRLWRALRIQIDVGFHTKGWSYDKAEDLLVNELNWPEKAARADLNWYIEQPGVPLGYAMGWKMINILRDYEKDRLGKDFKLYDFHSKLLSQGSIGLPLVIKTAFGKEALKQVYREFRKEL